MPNFKLAAAQVASVRGDIARNIATRAVAIESAAKHDVSVLVFPELSLTGYELDRAAELAMTATDSRLAPLLTLTRQHQIEVVMGVPLHNGTAKPFLGAILASPQGPTKTYYKMHLGGNEPNYFTPGDTPLALSINGQTMGDAICADAAKATHPQGYAAAGANIYAAGIFLTAEWYATDAPRLVGYAVTYRMLILMANHAASVGTYTSVGKSAVWAPDGSLSTALLLVTIIAILCAWVLDHRQLSDAITKDAAKVKNLEQLVGSLENEIKTLYAHLKVSQQRHEQQLLNRSTVDEVTGRPIDTTRAVPAP